MDYPVTPDGRYFVVRGRLWRMSNPSLHPDTRHRLGPLDHGGHRTAAGAGPAGTSGWLFRARTVPEYRDWYFSSGWEAGSDRSEERSVGKEGGSWCRSWGSPSH